MSKITDGDKLIIMLSILGFTIIGFIIGASITPGSIVKTKTVEVQVPCEHSDVNDTGLIETSLILDTETDYPLQRTLYHLSTGDTYVYTFYYEPRENYSTQRILKDTDIVRVSKDGFASEVD